MKTIIRWTISIFTLVFIVSCSVISRDIRTEAQPAVPFPALEAKTESYVGETVILGGYILDTRNEGDQTRLTLLQAPLGFADEPKSPDESQGRFVVSHPGYLDPEVYNKGRKITVGGMVVGCEEIRADRCFLPEVRSRELYLWPEYRYGEIRHDYGYCNWWRIPFHHRRYPVYGHGPYC